jgi:hypothetical protein
VDKAPVYFHAMGGSSANSQALARIADIEISTAAAVGADAARPRFDPKL